MVVTTAKNPRNGESKTIHGICALGLTAGQA